MMMLQQGATQQSLYFKQLLHFNVIGVRMREKLVPQHFLCLVPFLFTNCPVT